MDGIQEISNLKKTIEGLEVKVLTLLRENQDLQAFIEEKNNNIKTLQKTFEEEKGGFQREIKEKSDFLASKNNEIMKKYKEISQEKQEILKKRDEVDLKRSESFYKEKMGLLLLNFIIVSRFPVSSLSISRKSSSFPLKCS